MSLHYSCCVRQVTKVHILVVTSSETHCIRLSVEQCFNSSLFSVGLSSDVEGFRLPVQSNVFTIVRKQNLLKPRSPCELGGNPCVFSANYNGTNLLWDDMRRTLAFAWDLHVFGSASLFILMSLLAAVGIAGASSLPRPICDALILANSLLILGGILRGVLLLLDPYGTRQILSLSTLAALHNLPLQIFLWAQVVLAVVILRELNLVLFLLKLQHPWVVGGLALSHCLPLLVADLFSPTLSSTVPLLLQTLSLCCELPICIGILPKSCSRRQSFASSTVPRWVPTHRIETCAKQVTTACALLGILCCSLQIYSLLWLYGLLGNWRRFGWGWWLSQFWARILELSWGFSLLVLGSRLFWMPSRSHLKSDRGQISKEKEKKNFTDWVLDGLNKKGPLRKSEKTWEELMPSNWAMYRRCKAGFSNSLRSPYADQPSTVTESMSDPDSNGSCDSQAALLWQKIGERECILSLIEFDMRPPSPINLRRSIDNAFHHGQLGTLFTPPPPSWTHSLCRSTAERDLSTSSVAPSYIGYGWTLDTESIAASLDHFQTKDVTQFPHASTDCYGGNETFAVSCKKEEYNCAALANGHQHDWFNDDVTDL